MTRVASAQRGRPGCYLFATGAGWAGTKQIDSSLGDGKDGGLRIACNRRRHHRRIRHTQAGNSDDAQPWIDDCTRIGAEAAGTDRMKRRVRLLADVRANGFNGCDQRWRT